MSFGDLFVCLFFNAYVTNSTHVWVIYRLMNGAKDEQMGTLCGSHGGTHVDTKWQWQKKKFHLQTSCHTFHLVVRETAVFCCWWDVLCWKKNSNKHEKLLWWNGLGIIQWFAIDGRNDTRQRPQGGAKKKWSRNEKKTRLDTWHKMRLVCVFFHLRKIMRDRRMDGPTDGRIGALIEMQRCI